MLSFKIFYKEKKNQKQLKLVIELCIFKLFNIYIKELK